MLPCELEDWIILLLAAILAGEPSWVWSAMSVSNHFLIPEEVF